MLLQRELGLLSKDMTKRSVNVNEFSIAIAHVAYIGDFLFFFIATCVHDTKEITQEKDH